MKLSAPIYHLKRNARHLARSEGISLHLALDRIAAEEGFKSWSLLAARHSESSTAARLHAGLKPGDMMLIGARPGQGKTLLTLEILVEAARHGGRGVFFTLEYTEAEVEARLASMGVTEEALGESFRFDCSDEVSADYIMGTLKDAEPGAVVGVDYLQLMDQKRTNPPLAEQMAALKAFAEKRGLIFLLISQIARTYDPMQKPVPDVGDVRLPNPLDMALFTKTHFIGQRATSEAA